MLYNFCPVCGQPLKYQELDGQCLPVCQNTKCGFVFWQNSKPCVSVLISDADGRVLMTVRGREPEIGKLDLPGGFLHEGEDPEVGAKREIREELGVEIELGEQIGLLVDRYGNDGEYTLTQGVTALIVSGMPQAADDAAAIEWIEPKTVDSGRLAFTNNEKFLRLWLKSRGGER